MRKITQAVLVTLVVLGFLSPIWPNRQIYLTRYDPQYWQSHYEESQWALGLKSTQPMGDSELYAYAGWRQVQGGDPTTINAEAPPLGKYLIGLSIIIFGNQFIQAILFGVGLALVTWLIARKIIKDNWWALLPVVFLAWDRLFQENLTASMLDLPFAFFIALAFFFIIKGREKKYYYLIAGGCFGAVSVIKMYLVGWGLAVIVAGYLAALFLLFRYKDIFWYMLSLPFFLAVYFGSYAVYFLNGRNLFDFKYLHFWIRHFARVQVENYSPLEIFRIMILGKWQTWWDNRQLVSVEEWNFLWPLGAVLTAINGFKGVAKKNLGVVILAIWTFSMLAMYAYGVPYPRYLLPILPPIYTIAALTLKKILENKQFRRNLWPNIKR